jgi:hypothetical protein
MAHAGWVVSIPFLSPEAKKVKGQEEKGIESQTVKSQAVGNWEKGQNDICANREAKSTKR